MLFGTTGFKLVYLISWAVGMHTDLFNVVHLFYLYYSGKCTYKLLASHGRTIVINRI